MRLRITMGPRHGKGRYRLQCFVVLPDAIAMDVRGRVAVQQEAQRVAGMEFGPAEAQTLRVWSVHAERATDTWEEVNWLIVEADGSRITWPR